MNIRSIIYGLLALPLAMMGNAGARTSGAEETPAALIDDSPFEIFPDGAMETFRSLRRPAGEPVQLAQVADPRLTGLEEQVRQLTGKLEELNFLILQMQEQNRKIQEDNEFRLQELEQKRTDAGGAKRAAADGAEAPAAETAPQLEASAAPAAPAETAPARAETVPAASDAAEPALPPRDIGSIIFDAEGNVKGASVDPSAVETPPPGSDGTTVAALPRTEDPQELYRNSYEFILSGDYTTAEAGFRDMIARFPDDAQTADAHYWLGEALIGQDRYKEAAEVFLAASRTYPDSRKSPDMLLKLGVSLSALNQRDIACATYGQIAQRYPNASAALKERVKQEQALAGC